MRPSRLLTLTTSLLLAATVGACNGDDGPRRVAPEAFATDVCNALGSLQTALETFESDLAEVGSSQTTDLAEVKDVLVASLGDVEQAALEGAEDVAEAGVPEDGGEVAEDIAALLSSVRRAFGDARLAAEQLPTDDPEGFAGQVQELITELEEASAGFGPTVEDLEEEYAELDLGEVEACRDLVG